MAWIYLAVVLVVFCFSFVLLYGAPYVPTLSRQVKVALNLLDLKQGETMLELGCGDGKVLIAAAERGWKVIGYELNPVLAAVAWLRTRKYGGRVQVKCADFWNAKWPETEGIYCFILPRLMQKLDKKVVQEYGKPVKVVSFAFVISTKKSAKEQDGVFLYEYK